METFLSKITREVLSRGLDWRDVSMVVPSRRAGVFLRREIARQYPRDTFLPRILPIEDLAVQIARIEKAEDLLPTLIKSFKQDKPVIIDCPIDYSENMNLTHHLEELMKEL